MVRLGCRKILVLFPLFITWIVFQSIRYNRRVFKYHSKIRNRNVSFENSTSVNERYKTSDWKHEKVIYDKHNGGYSFEIEVNEEHLSQKLWFMDNGSLRPEKLNVSVEKSLWPEQSKSDRIIEQLLYVPKNNSNKMKVPSASRKKHFKKILLIGDFDRKKLTSGRNIFKKHKCPVNTCTLASSLEEARNNDAVIFKGYYVRGIDMFIRRRPQHVWILHLLESPLNLGVERIPKDTINWTASYRRDSDIVTPYGKFVPYSDIASYGTQDIKVKRDMANYAANKTGKVAWFVSNCNAKNDRLLYAKTLSKYIEVDIFGSCGTKKCPHSKHKKCLEMLDRDYKFYLAFENSNCKDYITEKFYEYGLSRNILPIVMGPPREDYEEVAPPYSFIHVNDFATPKDLAKYLHILDKDDILYNEYFAWKVIGEFIDTHFWCRLCAMLHAPRSSKSYRDLQEWWSGPGICTSY